MDESIFRDQLNEGYYSAPVQIYRRFSRSMQLGGLIPVVRLGIPPGYRVLLAQVSTNITDMHLLVKCYDNKMV